MYPTLGRLAHRASRSAPSQDRGVLWRPELTEIQGDTLLLGSESWRVVVAIRGWWGNSGASNHLIAIKGLSNLDRMHSQKFHANVGTRM